MKASRTRKYNLEQKARQIKVEPSLEGESIKQQTKKWTCKKVGTVAEAEPREGSLVVEQVKGIWCVCSNCGHKWVHHSSKLPVSIIVNVLGVEVTYD